MKPTPSIRRAAFLLCAYVIALGTLGFVVSLFCGFVVVVLNDDGVLTAEEAFSAWGVPLPLQPQSMLLADGGFGSPYVSANFQATPQDAQPFIDGICDGELVQGYDPFVAQDMAEPLAGSILIKMQGFVYYSRSPEMPDTVWGVRCHALTNGVHQLRVDKSDSEMWTIRFEQPGGDCLRPESPVPQCGDVGAEYSNPIDDVPLMVIGLFEVGGEWVLRHPELCFEFLRYPLSIIGLQDEWQHYIGAIMEISIDNIALPRGIVHQSRRLLIADDFIVDTDIYGQNDIYWNVCAQREWSVGEHQVNIVVSPVSGEREIWSFVFQVVDEVDANT